MHSNFPILAVAHLLVDANIDVIGWSGNSRGWLRFKEDERLCAAITKTTGIPATTSTLALDQALDMLGAENFAFVTPCLDDVQARVIQTYSKAGCKVVSESHLKLSTNVTFADVPEETLNGEVKQLMEDGKGEVLAISTFCTDSKAARGPWEWEEKYGFPVLDTDRIYGDLGNVTDETMGEGSNKGMGDIG